MLSTGTLKDIANFAPGIIVGTYPSAINGTSYDRKSQDSVVILPIPVLSSGTTITLRLQESTDNSNWTNIVGAAIAVGALPNGTASVAMHVRLNGRGRYIRLSGAAPSSGSPVWGALLIFGESGSYLDNRTTWLTDVL